MTYPGYFATLLVAIVFVMVAVVPAEAWRNETRTVYTCNFTLTTVYYPAADRFDVPRVYNESSGTTVDGTFTGYLKQMWADYFASGHLQPFNMDQFVASMSGRTNAEWMDRNPIYNMTELRISRASPMVEGSFETETTCYSALGGSHWRDSVMATYVINSLELALLGNNASLGYFSEYNLQEQVVSERTYTVRVPTEEDYCVIGFSGVYNVDRPISLRNDATEFFRQEARPILANLTLFEQPWFSASVAWSDNNQLQFSTSMVILKDESVGLTSLLRPAVERTVEHVTNPPYDNSELRINSSLVCWQPPPVAACAQVSAKLESGAPFAINTTTTNITTEFLSGTFFFALYMDLETSEKVFNTNILVESISAVPLEEPDTLQVGVRVNYWAYVKDLPKAASAIGRSVTTALEATAIEVVASNLYEVNYTITPCRH